MYYILSFPSFPLFPFLPFFLSHYIVYSYCVSAKRRTRTPMRRMLSQMLQGMQEQLRLQQAKNLFQGFLGWTDHQTALKQVILPIPTVLDLALHPSILHIWSCSTCTFPFICGGSKEDVFRGNHCSYKKIRRSHQQHR